MAVTPGSRAEGHLKQAFAGESQANRRYLAFARKAEQDGHPQVAKLFRAAAAAETVHALAHLKVLGHVRETASNLRESISGETHEFMEMYPKMLQDATDEGEQEALRSFSFANTVEKVHARLFQAALEQLGHNPPVDYYVCQVCGHTLEGPPETPCEICGAAISAYLRID